MLPDTTSYYYPRPINEKAPFIPLKTDLNIETNGDKIPILLLIAIKISHKNPNIRINLITLKVNLPTENKVFIALKIIASLLLN